MKCLSCGSNIPDNAVFCPQCGAAVHVARNEDSATAGSIASAKRLVAEGDRIASEQPDIAGIKYRKALEVMVGAYIAKLKVSDDEMQSWLDSAGYSNVSRSGRLYQEILFLESAELITADQSSDAHFVRQFGNSCAHSDESVSFDSAKAASAAMIRLISSLEPVIFSARKMSSAELGREPRKGARGRVESGAFGDVMKGTANDLAGCGKSCLLVAIWLMSGFAYMLAASSAYLFIPVRFDPGATLGLYVVGFVLWLVFGIFLKNVEERW